MKLNSIFLIFNDFNFCKSVKYQIHKILSHNGTNQYTIVFSLFVVHEFFHGFLKSDIDCIRLTLISSKLKILQNPWKLEPTNINKKTTVHEHQYPHNLFCIIFRCCFQSSKHIIPAAQNRFLYMSSVGQEANSRGRFISSFQNSNLLH